MLPLPPLYPITDACLDMPLSEQIRRMGAAGFPLVQFRGKPLDAKTQMAELRKAQAEAGENGGWPMICLNDRADVAALMALEGCLPWGIHVGQGDLPPDEVRKLPGLSCCHLGISTHEAQEWDGVPSCCDHAGVGPFRATVTKGDHAPPIGLEGLRAGCTALRSKGITPIAIGGLRMEDALTCYEAGAESLAMVRELAQAEQPGELLWQAQLLRWRVRPPFRKGQGLALVGGSGSGKSTLGRLLGAELGLPFWDLDEVIVRKAGKSIARIFAEDGEPAFRRLEADATCEAFRKPAVLALGGGAWESAVIREAAGRAGYAPLWIAVNPGAIWERVAHDPVRPLAQDRSSYLERWRIRHVRWSAVPMILPLGRSAEVLAQTLASLLT